MDNNDQLNDLYEYGTQSSSRFSNSESTGAYYNNDERPTSKTSGAAKASLAIGIISIVFFNQTQHIHSQERIHPFVISSIPRFQHNVQTR